MFVKKFRSCQVGLIRIDDKMSRLVIDEDNCRNNEKSDEKIQWSQVENQNELLHLASLHGDIFHMLYALALNADKNSVIDQCELRMEKVDTNEPYEYNNRGFTPLIKAIQSVITYLLLQ